MKIFRLPLIFCIILLMGGPRLSSQELTAIGSKEEHWIDSVMKTLSPDEMIGQLIVVRANNPNEGYFQVIDSYIRNYGIGGVTFFGGKPYKQAVQTNIWQSISKVPLLISIDAEWGLGMRLDSSVSYPYQMTLGAIRDDSVSSAMLEEMGRQVGEQCRRLGIQMNFAPVVDVNSNPSNPVIHMRSFGEDKNNVSEKGLAYMSGMQEAGIMCSAKHFPGHGDTDTDSHLTLPVIRHDAAYLDSVELYPFKSLINAGLSGVMIAHLYIPALEPAANMPSTLSKPIITDLLRGKLGFEGLVITDALDMKGVTKYYSPGEIEVRALEAGNDILLLCADVPAAVAGIRNAITGGRLSETLIRTKCEKILRYKYRAGLYECSPVRLEGLHDDINPQGSGELIRKMFEEAVTLGRNEGGLLPLQRLDTLSIASVSIGAGKNTAFQERLKYYGEVTPYSVGREPAAEEISALLKKLEPFNLVIVSIQNTGIFTSNRFNISQSAINLVQRIQAEKEIILDVFASPYALALFSNLPNARAIIMSYQDHPAMQDISAQAIFGGTGFHGRLPVTVNEEFPLGSGMDTKAVRLKYTTPEEVGIRSGYLSPVDSIVEDCISKRVFPGCQILAAKNGKVFFLKSYGHTTYDRSGEIGDFHLYDLASLTKVVASTPVLMQLSEQGLVDLDQMLVHYLPELKGTNKASIIIRTMMTHQARLKPWIAFYTAAVKDGVLDPEVFSPVKNATFPTRVADGIFIREGYEEIIMDSIIASQLLRTSDYKYSDLGFYFLKKIIEKSTGSTLDAYAGGHFYRPLGMSRTGYLPRDRYPLEMIAPTENDTEFRHQLVHGDVHDQGAAMLGGVAGHAGVFSNANDLGKYLQMLLNGGGYGGERYIDSTTIAEFTRQQFPLNDNRRGIGFDKPLPEYDRNGPACKGAGKLSFGHSGFTGTYLWADPANGLVYVFLSNRVYPTAGNNKLSDWSIRPKIHQCFYDAIEKSKTFAPSK